MARMKLVARAAIALALACTPIAAADTPKLATQIIAQPVFGSFGAGAGSGGAVPVGLLVTLVDEGNHVVPGKLVKFTGTADGAQICSAVTGEDGRASCNDPATKVAATASRGFTATFAGDDTHAGSAVQAPLVRVNGQNVP